MRATPRSAGPGTAPATTVVGAMVRAPRVRDAGASVAEVRAGFSGGHVHAALLVERGVLIAVVDRADVEDAPPGAPARAFGRLAGRTVPATADLQATWRAMMESGRRRMAVVDGQGLLLGLLCLKRSGRGFCSDADVAARAADRRPRPAG